MSEKSYEKKYNDLMASLDDMHKRNVRKTSAALKSFLIIPTIFLILVFMTNSSKTVFLVLWIISMFAIAAVLIVTEYQDYSLRKMINAAGGSEEREELPEESPEAAEVDEAEESEASEAVEEAEEAVSQCADEVSHEAEEASEASAFTYDTPDESAVREEAEVGADS